MKRAGILFVLALFAVVSMAQATIAQDKTFAVGTTLEDFKLNGVDGKEHSFESLKGKNGTVLVFLSAQCPVVKQYNKRINEVAADYAARGISFVGINSNATESLDWIKSDAAEVGYKFPVLIDKGNVLADKLGATVTPEMYVFDAKSKLVYHGAIDNDRSGSNISENYLRVALDEKLSGKDISKNKTRAFGCTIKRMGM